MFIIKAANQKRELKHIKIKKVVDIRNIDAYNYLYGLVKKTTERLKIQISNFEELDQGNLQT